jgi:hypothetical protein
LVDIDQVLASAFTKRVNDADVPVKRVQAAKVATS